jgi:hypothetical protein
VPNPLHKFVVDKRGKHRFNPERSLTLSFPNRGPSKANSAVLGARLRIGHGVATTVSAGSITPIATFAADGDSAMQVSARMDHGGLESPSAV